MPPFNLITLLVFSMHKGIIAEHVQGLEKIGCLAKEPRVSCPRGKLLSSSICIPNEYRKGELPQIPLEINTVR